MSNRSFKIGDLNIGHDYEPVIIAEMGINHGGSLTVAKEMALAAQKAGVRILKHQTHVVEDEMTHEAKKVIPGNSDKSIYQIMDECSLNEEDEFKLKKYVESLGMIYLSTPFSRAAFYRLEKFNVQAYKIGSGECNNYPLLELVAATKKPVILSTGMNSIESIIPAVEILRKYKTPFALLHTTNLYPTPFNLVRLGAMTQLNDEFPDAIFGLSDHTVNNNACLAAVALGASILERHFTDSMDRKGPDIVNSMDPDAFINLKKGVHEIFQMRGGKKNPANEEKVTSDFAFATVVTINDIKEGDIFSDENIWVKRPGTGEILAKNYSNIIGKRAKRDLKRDEHLMWKDIEGDL